MRRPDHGETLHPPEGLGSSPAREKAKDQRLTRERVMRISGERRDMLSAVSREITAQLHAALQEKLRYEENLLSAAAAREEQETVARRRRQRDLPAEYFVKKRLDANLI